MAYLGIGYQGNDPEFLQEQIAIHSQWLKGDRLPRQYGNGFIVMYDSNTAQEFAKKCIESAPDNSIVLYKMDRTIQIQPSGNYQ